MAATLAATLFAFDTFDLAGQHLVDGRLLNLVLMLMLTTSILGRFSRNILLSYAPGTETCKGGLGGPMRSS